MLASTPSADVSINTDQNRFELRLNGDLVGIVGYFEVENTQKRGARTHVVSFMHTVVTEDFGHQGLAAILVRRSLDSARSYGWKVKPVCTYVQRFLAANPDYSDVVVPL
ncbi:MULTISPECIES: GNAT family N-acetyltransferase [Nocardiaceae]|jgi:predicted GNAT family acetyltransferase|uniref:GNAT family N-acetyltransferase n=1 Tax=Nocardiaceae TaxID=85025 RepID=UPI000372B2A6|nr:MULTISPECIES: GNAT family N-acetyltransferase [Rhodococcus]OZC48245.1 N-acetyltransferase [Rhodococcus sp. 06-621-2]OZD15247.1 N-acetyltransferase [Rhodococcus sp. 06-156-4C]OZD19665.1 N-acetyltransferase [Rhodococcus sp. 06-156-4a]OZD23024.1 N-acetyltransferase [Rhodococcus sp. 06-156-3C]OZD25683.1 N-acetyltransferase [Rhodococcus sp. 06-156-3b]